MLISDPHNTDIEPKIDGATVDVVYVLKENAKRLKSALEYAGLLDKNFRMAPAAAEPAAIAVPVVNTVEWDASHSWGGLIIGQGTQVCPYSTKVMGQRRQSSTPSRELSLPNLTLVQQAILLTVKKASGNSEYPEDSYSSGTLLARVEKLNTSILPRKLETFGDDRTVVVPSGAFEGTEFWSILLSGTAGGKTTRNSENHNRLEQIFWRQVADVHGASRIVRRGTIDPKSRIRQSGHRLVFPISGVPDSTGPGSPGWIRVTEQGIKQSFDMTRVMFSRGNISEKIRFGKMVRKGESVLDMYAGIGYYTFPALIHGQAKHVVACEWNKYAVQALRYNVNDNRMADRVTILEGDCRQSAAEHNLVGMFDRVSLGLLPSSEGGWITSVRALKDESGGWLHIHGNVPNVEKEKWALWLCKRLLDICDDMKRPSEWIVVCEHVEKVKSFAPTISHFVADVFLGPSALRPCSCELGDCRAGLHSVDGCQPCGGPVPVPSCALRPDGALSQAWMM